MSAKGAGIGASLGALLGLIFAFSTPSGMNLVPNLASAEDVESKILILFVIFILSAVGAVIGGLGDKLVKLISKS